MPIQGFERVPLVAAHIRGEPVILRIEMPIAAENRVIVNAPCANIAASVRVYEAAASCHELDAEMGKTFPPRCEKVYLSCAETDAEIGFRVQLLPFPAALQQCVSVRLAQQVAQQVHKMGAVVAQSLAVPGHALVNFAVLPGTNRLFELSHPGVRATHVVDG